MAAVFHASPNDSSDDEVTIILSPRGSLPQSASSPERRLVLTRKAPSIRIGRASKVPTKGFVAAKENAWFDSPVMSRQHAELIANFDTRPKTVSIKDAGSLHGTFHTPNDGVSKETRLEAQKPTKLANGDILRFGIDIFRSKETFPPCSVDFLMEEKAQQPSRSTKGTFSVPDDIDEDEIDYMSEISENDMVFEVQSDGRAIIPQVNAPVTPRQPFSIDLTGEDTRPSNLPNPSSSGTLRAKSDFVDLTSEPELDDSDPEMDAPAPSPQVHPVNHAVANPSLPVNDGNIGMQQSDNGFDTDYTSDRDDVGFRVDFDDDDEDDDDESDEELLRHSSLENESQASEDSEMSSDDNGTDHHESTSSEMGDEYDEANAFEEDNLHKPSYFEDSDSSSGDDADDAMLDLLSSSKAAPPTVLCPNGQTAAGSGSQRSSPGPAGPFPPASFSAASAASSVPQARQPSPSDAAMFKSRPVFNPAPSESRAQALGEVTGKYEYFAARENNRAAVSFHETAVPVSAIRETLQSEPEVSHPTQNHHADMEGLQPDNSMNFPEVSAPITTSEAQAHTPIVNLRASSTTQDSAWSASGERFINNPSTDELPPLSADRAQSPEFDMTSAFTFQQSKLATEAKTRHNIRRLPIKDLLAQEPKDSSLEPIQSTDCELPDAPDVSDIQTSPMGTKRSFEEAFDDSEHDMAHPDQYAAKIPCYIQTEGELMNPQAGLKPRPLSSPHSNQNVVLEQELVDPNAAQDKAISEKEPQEPVIVSVQKTIARPSKRLRLAKAAAYVSCAALGGAAAFSVLVSTAPF
ncbi:hypothetical protein F5X96DRAFT_662988 [Biscogniauxia mediterranea]|nr:hypothetical protein F5X96DRAFT_662988 [Biscogniauxia mediterranea]